MSDKVKLSDMRREYKKIRLSEKNINPDPLVQFKKWFEEAVEDDFKDPNSMTLATATTSGKPSARIVLLKEFDSRGFVFYTNYKSRKSQELLANPYASLLFYWDKLERQIRIDGCVEKISRKESEEYFKTRPLKARLGAWASNQSSVIKDRSVIVKAFFKYLLKFGKNVPLPPFWGGYRLIPYEFEFWQGRPNRLHDRIRYSKQKDIWKMERLAP